MSDMIFLPVSLGEALDKLSILDIKMEKIKDSRLNDVKNEYIFLYDKLLHYVEKYNILYDLLKTVNLEIWEYMDLLRDGNLSDDIYFDLNKKTIFKNDVRFRIKNKINVVSKSFLKEQKSYNITKKLVDLTNGKLVDAELFKKLVEYSLDYDQLTILCNDMNFEVIQEKFNYDKTIIIYFS